MFEMGVLEICGWMIIMLGSLAALALVWLIIEIIRELRR
jgi:hypothetical protein